MSTHRHTLRPDHTDASENGAANGPWSPGRLRHELANLLDGSMRHLSLAIRELNAGADEPASPEAPPSADAVRRLQLVKQALERMTRLLPDRRRASDDPDSELLGEVIAQLWGWIEPLAQAQNTRVRTQIAPDVAAHPAGMIEPILRNALRNSLEAIHAADPLASKAYTIEIRASREREHLRIEITDDGPGIDPALFDDRGRFRFGHSTRGPSRGQGLSLSADLVATRHGSIEVTNRVEGGAQVRIDLPLVAAARQPK